MDIIFIEFLSYRYLASRFNASDAALAMKTPICRLRTKLGAAVICLTPTQPQRVIASQERHFMLLQVKAGSFISFKVFGVDIVSGEQELRVWNVPLWGQSAFTKRIFFSALYTLELLKEYLQ